MMVGVGQKSAPLFPNATTFDNDDKKGVVYLCNSTASRRKEVLSLPVEEEEVGSLKPAVVGQELYLSVSSACFLPDNECARAKHIHMLHMMIISHLNVKSINDNEYNDTI